MAAPANCSVEVTELYKIYGADPIACIERLRDGMSKDEILRTHNHVVALNDVNLRMTPGKIQVIMGLSGSGKSTLVRHLNRLIDPTAGAITVDGVDITQLDDRELQQFRSYSTAMVFQKFALLPHRTVLENVAYGLTLRRPAVRNASRKAAEWLERVGLAGYERHYPNQLSGGMQQRVGIARALAMDAPLLLMDEAFSALDPIIRVDMQNMLLELQKELRKTIVFITHDLDEALTLGDRIAILKDGEVVQQGSVEEILVRPATPYVEKFVREVNRARFLRAETGIKPVTNPEDVPPIRISRDTTMECALKTMADHETTSVCVIDDEAIPIGTLDWKTAVSMTTRFR